MANHSGRLGALMLVAVAACGHSQPAPVAAVPMVVAPRTIKLIALPAESTAFPRAAQAATDSLRTAEVAGLGPAEISKVSLEVVQLLLECVDPTETCYSAVGHSLTANGLLFAQIAPSGDDARRGKSGRVARPTDSPQPLKITVTLFDVDARAPRMKAERVFASEEEATAGVAELVAEATRP